MRCLLGMFVWLSAMCVVFHVDCVSSRPVDDVLSRTDELQLLSETKSEQLQHPSGMNSDGRPFLSSTNSETARPNLPKTDTVLEVDDPDHVMSGDIRKRSSDTDRGIWKSLQKSSDVLLRIRRGLFQTHRAQAPSEINPDEDPQRLEKPQQNSYWNRSGWGGGYGKK